MTHACNEAYWSLDTSKGAFPTRKLTGEWSSSMVFSRNTFHVKFRATGLAQNPCIESKCIRWSLGHFWSRWRVCLLVFSKQVLREKKLFYLFLTIRLQNLIFGFLCCRLHFRAVSFEAAAKAQPYHLSKNSLLSIGQNASWTHMIIVFLWIFWQIAPLQPWYPQI